MAEGAGVTIGSAVVGGIAGPIVQPLVRWLELRRNSRSQVARTSPALIVEWITHECDDLDGWIPNAREILREDKYVKHGLWDRVMQLPQIGAPLIDHGYWCVEDVRYFQSRRVEVVGTESLEEKLALILWGIHEGVLKATGGASSGSEAVDGAVDIRRQDPVDSSHATVTTFYPNTPEAGVPIPVSKVIVPMVIDIRQRPTPTLLISERVATDVGTLVHDTRGGFEVEVQLSLSRSLGEIVGSLDPGLLPRDHGFELGLMDSVEWFVTDFTCITGDRRYKRPIRLAEWPYREELGSEMLPFSTTWFDEHEDGDNGWEPTTVGGQPGKVSVNSNEELTFEVRWAVEAWKLLGGRVEYVEHEFGLVWITLPYFVTVILGQAELPDAMRQKDKLASTHANGWSDAGAGFLYLIGWHDGPFENEVGEDWWIGIYGQSNAGIPGLVGYQVLRALPLNLC